MTKQSTVIPGTWGRVLEMHHFNTTLPKTRCLWCIFWEQAIPKHIKVLTGLQKSSFIFCTRTIYYFVQLLLAGYLTRVVVSVADGAEIERHDAAASCVLQVCGSRCTCSAQVASDSLRVRTRPRHLAIVYQSWHRRHPSWPQHKVFSSTTLVSSTL